MMHLTTNVRLTDNDTNFAQWLLDVGDAKLSTNNRIVIPFELLSDNLIDNIYGKYLTANYNIFNNRCILTPRNNTLLDVNEDVFNRLEGDARDIYTRANIEFRLTATIRRSRIRSKSTLAK